MTGSAKVFRKLYFLIILMGFSYISTTLTTQNNNIPDMPPLEDFLKNPAPQNTSQVDANLDIQKNAPKWSFFQKIKDFFTFKSKESAIGSVEVEKASNGSTQVDEQESFIDLGNNKLKTAKASDKDVKESVETLKQFQDASATAKQPEAEASAPASININTDNVAPSAQNENAALPIIQDRNQSNITAQNNQVQQAAPQLKPTTTTVPVKNNKAQTVTKSNEATVDPSTTNQAQAGVRQTIADPVDQAVPVTDDSTKVAEAPSALPVVPAPSEVTANKIPTLPEIPDSFEDDPNASANNDVSSQSSEVPSLPGASSASKGITNAAAVENTAVVTAPSLSAVPSVPEVPSVPLEPPQSTPSSLNSTTTTEEPGDLSNSRFANDESSSDLSKFVLDEAKVLLLPNDDVVLGEISETASLEQMDFLAYSKLFEDQLKWAHSSAQRSIIENFLKNYEANFNKITILTDVEAATQAFKAVSKNRLFVLRTLLDNNHLLQAKDAQGNTLLHIATECDNYYLAKYLIIRGVNLSSYNYDGETSLMISEETGNVEIARLLKAAGSF